MLRLIERGLKKISGNENKLSKIMADIFFFLYVAASHGTTTFKPYQKSTLWVAKMYAATWANKGGIIGWQSRECKIMQGYGNKSIHIIFTKDTYNHHIDRLK